MGVAEGHAFAHQVIRRVGRVGKAAGRRSRHPLVPEAHRGDHPGEEPQAGRRGIHRIEAALLVLLHILIVGQGNALHRRQQAKQRAVDAPGLAADQFRDIRVLLLRHDAAAGAVGVIDLHKAVLVAVPDDDLLAEAGKMHHDDGERREELEQVIPVRDGVHAVPRGSGKPEQRGRQRPVQGIGRPRQRAGAEGAVIHPAVNIRQPLPVSAQHLEIRAEVMGQGDRLRLLQVGEPGHEGLRVCGHHVVEGLQQALYQFVRLLYLIPGIEPHVEGDLVIAAAPGVQLLAELPDPLSQHRFHEAVHILAGLVHGQGAGLDILQDALQSLPDAGALLLREDARLFQGPHMRETPPDILGEKPLVKSDRCVECVDHLVCFFGKPSAPELRHVIPPASRSSPFPVPLPFPSAAARGKMRSRSNPAGRVRRAGKARWTADNRSFS